MFEFQEASHAASKAEGGAGALRQAILSGATALVVAGALTDTAVAAACGANTSVSAGETCTGVLRWTLSAGTLTNEGTISSTTSDGSVGVLGTGVLLDALINHGTITATGTAVQVWNNGALTNLVNTGLIHSPGGVAYVAFDGSPAATITNSGTIYGGVIARGAGVLTIHGGASDYGTFTSSYRTIESEVAGLVFASGYTHLDMNVDVGTMTATNAGATLKITNNRTINGHFAQTGGTLVFAGTAASMPKLTVARTAALTGGDIILIPVSGTLAAGDFTILSAIGGVTSSATVSSAGFDATSTISGNNLIVNLAAIATPAPAQPPKPTIIDASQPSFSFDDPAAERDLVTFDGGVLQTAGRTTDQAFLIRKSGGTFDVISGVLVLSGPVTNNGALMFTGAGRTDLAGSVINDGTLIFDAAAALRGTTRNDGRIEVRDGRGVDLVGELANAGTLVYAGAGVIGGVIGNTGVIDIQGGRAVDLVGSIVNAGSLRYDATGALNGTITNTGTVDIVGGRQVSLGGVGPA